MAEKIKVLIVDDSALVRQVIAQALSTDAEIEVIGTASDPLFAIQKMKLQWPDVLVIDIEMPRMDGITFHKKIMAQRPTPVVICSSLAEQGAQVALDALAAGAVSLITKPKIGLKAFLDNAANDIIQAVKAAAKSRPSSGGISSRPRPATPMLQPTPSLAADVILPPGPAPLGGTTWKVIAGEGQTVAEGDVLLILEAMKMETEIRAAQAGTVRGIAVKSGDAVSVGDTLMTLA